MKRQFNKKAYDAFDSKNKKEILSIMSKKGYTLVGNLEEEHYKNTILNLPKMVKKYPLKMKPE